VPGFLYFDRSDYRRSYLLPDTAASNIPQRPAPGEPGAYNHARGLLVELSRALRGEPTSLRYTDRCEPTTRRHVDTEVTATVTTASGPVTVVLTHGSAPESPRGDHWQITVNGRIPDDGTGRHLPSLPALARRVDLALQDDPAPQDDPSSGPDPTHPTTTRPRTAPSGKNTGVTVTCAACGAAACTGRADGAPRCARCSIRLFRCELTGDWVSAATQRQRQFDADNEGAIAGTRAAAQAALPESQNLIPPSWRATVHQGIPGAVYTLRIQPIGAADVSAYLSPPTADGGWHVEIHNRTRRIGFPLYIPGGARAALYDTVPEAVAAAVNAVQIELSRRY
jgi:hypothetical protein